MPEHTRAQLLRFVRMTGYALAAQFLLLGRWPGWSGAWALGAGTVETVLREMLPVKPIPTVASVPAPPPTSPNG